MSGSLDQELNRVTMTPETSTSTPAASSVPPSFPAALLSISLDFLHVVSPLSLIWLSSCASMNQCTSAFMFLLILTFCVFILCLPVFFNQTTVVQSWKDLAHGTTQITKLDDHPRLL